MAKSLNKIVKKKCDHLFMKIIYYIGLFLLFLTAKAISEITYLEILKDPTDLRLNLQYAKEQEAKGEFKSVIATLERLNALYPNNIAVSYTHLTLPTILLV